MLPLDINNHNSLLLSIVYEKKKLSTYIYLNKIKCLKLFLSKSNFIQKLLLVTNIRRF